MTINKLIQEMESRIEYLIEKRKRLVVREMHPSKMQKLHCDYGEEIDALAAALRPLKEYHTKLN